jgi:RNA polymerase sigma-70 factor, ECF subfamily
LDDPARNANPDQLYAEAADTYGAALERLARAYEANPDRRQDLLQEIHLALWRSLEHFAQRCSRRTWVYQVAHNIAGATPTSCSLAWAETFYRVWPMVPRGYWRG